MSRRVSLPAADDLFRPTAAPDEVSPARDEPAPDLAAEPSASPQSSGEEEAAESAPAEARPASRGAPRTKEPSGRVRHDEKMTVYVTAEELLDLEQTRLTLRTHGISVDRGRLVREAVAIALAEFETSGQDSLLVRRLTDS